MEKANEILRMKDITKIYGNGVLANSHVDFSVTKGEIHALMGENGAGKSTLMKVLFGIEQPDEGSIEFDGSEIKIGSPDVALGKGIGMVHQHFKLIPSLTVAENIVLGKEPKKHGMLNQREAVKTVKDLSEKFGFDVDPTAKVKDLSVGKKQKVEILKSLYRDVKLLILDEPTAVLTPQETEELFEQLVKLKKSGLTIIFISHKLNEIKQICERITIMRHGKSVGTYAVEGLTMEEISRLMVGRDIILNVEKKKGNSDIKIDGVSVLGQSTKNIRKKGVSYIPEDRTSDGAASEVTIRENLISSIYDTAQVNKGPFMDRKKINSWVEKCQEDYDIRCDSLQDKIGMLSGGNMQKVVVAREFSTKPSVLIADQPTRGVDVGAIEFIHKKIVEIRDEGCAVLLVSADLNEILELADSILVMYQGKVAGYFPEAKKLSEEELGYYMLGVKQQSEDEIRRACFEE